MADKTPTYLKFDGTAAQRVTFQGPPQTNATGTLVVTLFVRFLEWPVSSFVLWEAGDADETDGEDFGMFVYADEFAKADPNRHTEGDELVIACRWSTTSGVAIEQLFPLSGSGVPGRLGAIYQIQMALLRESQAGGRVRMNLFVDGAQVGLSNNTRGGNIGPSGAAGNSFQWGGLPIQQLDEVQAEQGPYAAERGIWELHQFMWEVDRTLTTSGSNIDPPDGVLDPFVGLEIDASADSALSFAHWLDEGTGTTISTDSGVSFDGTVQNPDWADQNSIDPLISGTSGAWNFNNVKGYPLRDSDSPDVTIQPIFAPTDDRPDATGGEIRLRLLPAIWKEHGDMRSAEWTSTTNLTGDSTEQKAIETKSIKGTGSPIGSATANVNDHGGTSSGLLRRWYRSWFYDEVGSDTSTQHRLTLFDGGTIEYTVGVHANQTNGLTNYYTRADQGGAVDSGVTRTVGWHEFAMFLQFQAGVDTTIKFYIDGALVRTESGNGSGPDAITPGIRLLVPTATDEAYYDWMAFNKESSNTPTDFLGFVPSTGQIVLPQLQPPGGVSSFDSVTFSDATAGISSMERGSITYEFRHDDGGGFGAFQTLNDANLQALTPGGGGQDIIEVRVTLNSGMDQMGSAAVRQIVINWSEAAVKNYYSGGFANRQRLTRGVGWVV